MDKEEFEFELQRLELRKKNLEIEKLQQVGKNRVLTPVLGTVIVAMLGLFGSFITNSLQTSASLAVEKQKFQFKIYSQAQSVESPEKAAEILDFYIKAKLIPGTEGEFSALISAGELDKVPILKSITKSLKEVYGDIEIPTSSKEEFGIENHFLTGKNVDQVLSTHTGGKFKFNSPDAIIFDYSGNGETKENIVAYLNTETHRMSQHFIIGKDGSITQLIPLNYNAWGIVKGTYDNRTNWNAYSIQIEFENSGLIKKIGNEYFSDYNLKIKKEHIFHGTHKREKVARYWEKYTKAQIESAEKLCKLLIENYNIKYILGHDDLSKRTLYPGPAFPLENFQKMLN